MIDWCCFYYSIRNSLVALLEALFARIYFRFENQIELLVFDNHIFCFACSKWKIFSTTKAVSPDLITSEKHIFEHMELPANLLDYFLRNNKSNINQYIYMHQEIKCVILCRWILNDIIIHIKFLNDIIILSKMVWHFHFTNFEDYAV